MDDRNQRKGSQQAPQARSTSADLSAQASTVSGQMAEQSAGEPGIKQSARYAVELRAADGQTVYASSGTVAWRALHEFGGLASQDLGQRFGVGTSARLTDRDGVYGVQLEVDSSGTHQLTFDSEKGRALYRQVYRERQLALSQAPMNNRIEAMAAQPEQGASARIKTVGEEQESRPPAGFVGSLREKLLAQLELRSQPEALDTRQQEERDREIVGRASASQLRRIAAELDKDDPAQVRQVLDQVKREVEHSVGHKEASEPGTARTKPGLEPSETAEDRPKTQAPISPDPPIRERFTAIERTWRTDYWQRDRPDRLGFTETWLTLKTAEHSAAVLMAMVDRARERGWTKLHLDGSAEFKREAWILATARGLETSGYTATLGDKEAVKAEEHRLERSSSDRNRTDEKLVRTKPVREASSSPTAERTPQGRDQKREAQVQAVLAKAMKDARIPPALQSRLRELLATPGRLPQHSVPGWQLKVYDVAAPRSKPGPEIATRSAQKNRQQER